MTILIVGDAPFTEAIESLCQSAGQSTLHYETADFMATQPNNLAAVQTVIELCHTDSKATLLQAIGQAVSADVLILSSALTASATQASAWTVCYPERVVGFAAMVPLSDENTIELSRALQTGDASWQRANEFWQNLKQTSVTVRDGVGLVRARLVCCIINEAATALQENVAAPADIDLAMKLGTNYPHGPLAWADMLGLDTVFGVMNGLYQEWNEDRYRPAPLLKRMVLAGQLGQKTGQGFYSYQ